MQLKFSGKTTRFYQLAGGCVFLLASLQASPATPVSDPAVQAVERFYQAVDSGDCETAIQQRIGYSIDSCKKVQGVFLHTTKLQHKNARYAVVLIETDIESQNKNHYFRGYTRLEKINGKWYIIGPYKSAANYTLDDYLDDFVKTGSSDKTTQQSNSNKTLPPVEPLEIPPDAAPPRQVPLPDKPQSPPGRQTHVTRADRPPPSSERSAMPKPRTELDNYLEGVVHIEGNQKIILDNIRQLFPDTVADIILVDLSLGLLHFYDSENRQLGLFPVLSTGLGRFPAGLYKINQQELEPVANEQSKTRSITLEKLIRGKNPELLVEGYYYLRDYFDSDQKNSLALSPVDNSKLNLLIQQETLLYVAK